MVQPIKAWGASRAPGGPGGRTTQTITTAGSGPCIRAWIVAMRTFGRRRPNVRIATIHARIHGPLPAVVIVCVVLPPGPPGARLAPQALIGCTIEHGDDSLVTSGGQIGRASCRGR